ncbi:hypothetical protein [Legionella gratiana]|uniref:hypothetical protein n=1 Tax=Legionella gratiana TaxID=45066 RepID=UPI001EE74C60|nr:hypothetical protein [Legionella gratiana]
MQDQKKELAEHKEYFAQSKINYAHLALAVLLISAFFIGWKAERKRWTGKVMQQIAEVGALAFLNHFKKTLFALFE